MKNFALLVASIFVLASCGGVEQHRAAIEEVSTEWTATTESVTAFSEQFTAAQSDWSAKLNSMTQTAASLGDAAPEGMDALLAQGNALSADMSGMATELFDFIGQWQTKGEELTALQTGLESGSIEGDVTAKIAGLKEMMATGTTNLTVWQEKLAGFSATAQTLSSQFQSMVPAPTSEG